MASGGPSSSQIFNTLNVSLSLPLIKCLRCCRCMKTNYKGLLEKWGLGSATEPWGNKRSALKSPAGSQLCSFWPSKLSIRRAVISAIYQPGQLWLWLDKMLLRDWVNTQAGAPQEDVRSGRVRVFLHSGKFISLMEEGRSGKLSVLLSPSQTPPQSPWIWRWFLNGMGVGVEVSFWILGGSLSLEGSLSPLYTL